MARYEKDWEVKTDLKILGEVKGQSSGKSNYCFQVGDTIHAVVFEYELVNSLKSEFRIRPLLVRMTSSGYTTEVLADWKSNHSEHPFFHAIRLCRSTDNPSVIHIAWVNGVRVYYKMGTIVNENSITWSDTRDTGWNSGSDSLSIITDLGGYPWLAYANENYLIDSMILRRSSTKNGVFTNDPSGYLEVGYPSAVDCELGQLDTGIKMILLYRKKKSETEVGVFKRIYNGGWLDEVDQFWETNAHGFRLGRLSDRIGVIYVSGSYLKYRAAYWEDFGPSETIPILQTDFIEGLGISRGIVGGSPSNGWIVWYQDQRLPLIRGYSYYPQVHFAKIENYGSWADFEGFQGKGLFAIEPYGTDSLACVTLLPSTSESQDGGLSYFLGALSLKKVV